MLFDDGQEREKPTRKTHLNLKTIYSHFVVSFPIKLIFVRGIFLNRISIHGNMKLLFNGNQSQFGNLQMNHSIDLSTHIDTHANQIKNNK